MKTWQRSIAVGSAGSVSSVWSGSSARGWAVILAHGAGGDMHAPFLHHLQEGLTARGGLSVRFNFLYKEQGRRVPDRAPLLEATWRAMVQAVREEAGGGAALILAGKSMGGRIASHLAAAGERCTGLLFFGYPLHPPRRPQQLRSAHFDAIGCPMLFVQGSRDPLCDLALLRRELGAARSPWRLHVIEGGDHSFAVPKRTGRTSGQVWDEVLDVSARWIADTLGQDGGNP